MDYLRTDEEQGEALKKWLRDNGFGLLIALAVGISSVLGYQKWEDHRVMKQFEAASLYQELVELSAIYYGDDETDTEYQRLLSIASAVRGGHDQTNYSMLSAGIVAAQAVERSDFDLAVSQLTYALNKAATEELKALISLRLARLELELDQLDAALMRVRNSLEPGFAATRAELEGDILVAKGLEGEARVNYLEARRILISQGRNTALVDLKLSGLPDEVSE